VGGIALTAENSDRAVEPRGRPFRPGQSGNPGGHPRLLAEVRDLARASTSEWPSWPSDAGATLDAHVWRIGSRRAECLAATYPSVDLIVNRSCLRCRSARSGTPHRTRRSYCCQCWCQHSLTQGSRGS
jgi:hypothetical protein